MSTKTSTIINADLCVVGGGMAGICAAVAAARHGVKTVLVHDRPVLGGNASSEIRMWIRGASISFPDYREGGIIEEIAMANMFYNPNKTYPLWDGVLYQLVTKEPNLTLLLNAHCIGGKSTQNQIEEIHCRQLSTYKDITIKASIYADCSGDCILADCSGAEVRVGREAKHEFNESYALEVADKKTMGNSCLVQARELNHEVKYTPPIFAKKFCKEDFIYRLNTNDIHSFKTDNFWWLELGGEADTIKDAEEIKHDLLCYAYGAWDFIKNSGCFDSKNWDLEFVSFVSGKRESRRYVGDYTLTQNDILTSASFDDEVAYGGWTMDDHNPAGMAKRELPNVHYKVSKPYPIPYRCLYSKNIANLMFAGRNISATHLAMSSTRVMATCAIMGQAVGTAASIALNHGITPKDVGERIDVLKATLRDDDCYLLSYPRQVSDTIKNAAYNADKSEYQKLLTGIERKIDGVDCSLELELNEPFRLEFSKTFCKRVRLVFDNDIAREGCVDRLEKMYPQKCNVSLNDNPSTMPPNLARKYSVSVKVQGEWRKVYTEQNNYLRLKYIDINAEIEGICLNVEETYSTTNAKILSIDML